MVRTPGLGFNPQHLVSSARREQALSSWCMRRAVAVTTPQLSDPVRAGYSLLGARMFILGALEPQRRLAVF